MLEIKQIRFVAMAVGTGMMAGALMAQPAMLHLAANADHSASKSQSYLGVDLRDVSDEEVSSLRLKDARGAEVMRVDHDGPAGKAGLRVHDVIVQMNGMLVQGEDQLRRMLSGTAPGKKITLLVCRDGQQQTVTAEMAKRSDIEKKAWSDHYTVPDPGFEAAPVAPPPPSPSFGSRLLSVSPILVGSGYTGASLDVMGAQLAGFFGVKDGKGLLVHSVDANSPAAVAGLHAGDVVTKVNGTALAKNSDWFKLIRESKGRSVTLTVVRDKQEQMLQMTPDPKRHSRVEHMGPAYEPHMASEMARLDEFSL